MDIKNTIEFINTNFTMHSDFGCYNKLIHFADAMHCGQCFPITDEEIRRGVEFKKAEGKALLKSIDTIIPDKDKRLAETMVETFCNQSLQQFLDYKHTHENQNNCVY